MNQKDTRDFLHGQNLVAWLYLDLDTVLIGERCRSCNDMFSKGEVHQVNL